MSGFAFSHQFSQRWLTTPSAVKQTIVQELDDIVTLLQPTTELEQFQFRVENLDDAVESLMQVERIRLQAEREEAERLAAEQREKERLEQEQLEKERLERERLEQERLEQERLEAERLEQERLEQERLAQARLETEALEQARLEQDRIEIEKLENDYKIAKKSSKKKSSQVLQGVTASPTAVVANEVVTDDLIATSAAADITVERHTSEMVYAISNGSALASEDKTDETDETKIVVTAHQPTEVLVKTLAIPADTIPNIEAIKQQIISELQVNIEKYLQESMRLMQEDLHQWLDEEVTRQLAQHLNQLEQ